MRRDRALGSVTLPARHHEPIANADPRNPEYLLHGFDIALDRSGDPVRMCRNFAHLQCACERAEQSSSDSRHDVIEGGGHVLIRLDPVELLDTAVDTETDRGIEALEKRLSDRSPYPLDPHTTRMNDLSHDELLSIETTHLECYNHWTMRQSTLSPSVLGIVMIVIAGGLACGGTPAPESEPAVAPVASIPEAGTPAAIPEEGPEGVVNYTRVDATVACAGTTPPEAMADLKELGFEAVINFRTVEERGATVNAGQTAAEAAGLKYYHFPFRDPTPGVADMFLETVADPSNQPVYIHCGSANRVGAMWLIKRVKLDGWSVEDAMAEAEMIGLRSRGLKEFAVEYVGDGV